MRNLILRCLHFLGIPTAEPTAARAWPEWRRSAQAHQFNLSSEQFDKFKADGSLPVVDVDGHRLVLVAPEAHLIRVNPFRLELQFLLSENTRITGDTDVDHVNDLVLWLDDATLTPRFAEWRAADAAAHKIGAPTPGRDLHLPGGLTLLCCHLAGDALDSEGRAPVRCHAYQSTTTYRAENADAFCLTREDGECTSTDPRCMHNRAEEALGRPGDPDGPCPHCGSTPYDAPGCPRCGKPGPGVTMIEPTGTP